MERVVTKWILDGHKPSFSIGIGSSPSKFWTGRDSSDLDRPLGQSIVRIAQRLIIPMNGLDLDGLIQSKTWTGEDICPFLYMKVKLVHEARAMSWSTVTEFSWLNLALQWYIRVSDCSLSTSHTPFQLLLRFVNPNWPSWPRFDHHELVEDESAIH